MIANDHPEIDHTRECKYNPYRSCLTTELPNGCYNMDGIIYPVPCDSKTFAKIERQNPGLSICVYGITKGSPFPKIVSKVPVALTHKELNLLYISSEYGNTHYALIHDFNTFMYRHKKHESRKYACRRCLHACVLPRRITTAAYTILHTASCTSSYATDRR